MVRLTSTFVNVAVLSCVVFRLVTANPTFALALIGALLGSPLGLLVAALAVVCRTALTVAVERAFDLPRHQYWLIPFRDLIANGHARLLGPSRLARAFPTWFDTTYFAEGLRRAEQRHKHQAIPA